IETVWPYKWTRVFSFQEQRKYLAVASATLKDVCSMLETGMRPEEVYRIRKENVYVEQGYLFNRSKDKGREAENPTNGSRAGSHKTAGERRKGEYLFPHRSDKDKPMLKVNNTSALKNSKVKTFRLYDLRHTWATRAAEAGFLLATGLEP